MVGRRKEVNLLLRIPILRAQGAIFRVGSFRNCEEECKGSKMEGKWNVKIAKKIIFPKAISISSSRRVQSSTLFGDLPQGNLPSMRFSHSAIYVIPKAIYANLRRESMQSSLILSFGSLCESPKAIYVIRRFLAIFDALRCSSSRQSLIYAILSFGNLPHSPDLPSCTSAPLQTSILV